MRKKVSIEFAHNFFQAYCIQCRSLCRELRMPQTAFDILMFLANNPDYNTAKDIVELRGLKANLVWRVMAAARQAIRRSIRLPEMIRIIR